MSKRPAISVRQLGLDLNYLNLEPEQKKALCENIITKALGSMKLLVSTDVQIESMKRVIQNSIEYNESEERYEYCQILKDIQDVLESQTAQ